MKTVTIQQPEHAPWIGFFHKMMRADEYIYLDNVQFKKRYFENRNKLRDGSNTQWLTVPVKTKNKYTQNINEVEIQNDSDWKKSYLGRLRRGISGAPFKIDILNWFDEAITSRKYNKLLDLNMEFINFGRKAFDINTPTIFASELNLDMYKSHQLILEICKKVKADQYISGPDGRNYLDIEEFKKAGISVIYHDFNHPAYPQWQGDFISHMSFIDLLANVETNRAKQILENI